MQNTVPHSSCQRRQDGVSAMLGQPRSPMQEVEEKVAGVHALYAKWRNLRANGGDEFEYTTVDLLSQLRGIEWDLQDLEDTVSIIKGDRQKTEADVASMEARERFIGATRKELAAVQEEVESVPLGRSSPSGFATKKSASGLSGKKACGHVALAQDEAPLVADEDEEMPSGGQGRSPKGVQEQSPASRALLEDAPEPKGCGCCPGFLLSRRGS